jgi:hypothetical protein
LLLGLFFTVTPMFAIDPFTAVGLGLSVVSGIFGGIGAGRARRAARRRERAAAARVMALEANRQDIPDFGQEFENPFANLQIATRAAEMQAEQADISLASTLDTLRATGASAGGATALARAAAQSKRGVSASIQQQEARNAQLRAQGEVQAAQMRQRAQMAEFQAQERREMQQLNRQSSLQSSASQQAAAYGAQQSQMFGQAIGAVGTFAMQGGFGSNNTTSDYGTNLTQNINPGTPTPNLGVSFNPIQVSNTTSLGGVTSFGSQQSTNPFQDIFNQRGFNFNPNLYNSPLIS